MDIETISESLALSFDTFPYAAIHAAQEQKEELLCLLLREIETYIAGDKDDRLVPTPIFFGIHLMAEWRETRAYRPFCRLISCDSDDLEELFGDSLTETFPRILASICDDDPQPLLDVVLNAKSNLWARNAACEAIAIAAYHGRTNKDKAASVIRGIFGNLEEREEKKSYVWVGLIESVALLGLEDMAPRVRRLFDEGYISPMMGNFTWFEQILRESTQEPDKYKTLWDDTIAEMENWHCFRNDEDDETGAYKGEYMSHLNAFRDVGRNDPCPCGSGKKFKKCCLDKNFADDAA